MRGKVVVITRASSGIGTAILPYFGFNSVVNPAVGPFETSAQTLTAAIVLVQAVTDAVSYWFNMWKGIDLRLLYPRIPPK